MKTVVFPMRWGVVKCVPLALFHRIVAIFLLSFTLCIFFFFFFYSLVFFPFCLFLKIYLHINRILLTKNIFNWFKKHKIPCCLFCFLHLVHNSLRFHSDRMQTNLMWVVRFVFLQELYRCYNKNWAFYLAHQHFAHTNTHTYTVTKTIALRVFQLSVICSVQTNKTHVVISLHFSLSL